jgi:hypothetical protein
MRTTLKCVISVCCKHDPLPKIFQGEGQAKKLLTSTFKPFKNAIANLKDAGISAVSYVSSVLIF